MTALACMHIYTINQCRSTYVSHLGSLAQAEESHERSKCINVPWYYHASVPAKKMTLKMRSSGKYQQTYSIVYRLCELWAYA